MSSIQVPMQLVLDELCQENARLSYDLAVARAQIKIMQTQGGESRDGDAQPAA